MVARFVQGHRQGLALLLLCLAQFMVVLDFSIVNIALPAMQQDLGFTTQNLQWIVTAYSLTFGGFLLLSGRLGDIYGRRTLFIIGLVLFTLSSLAGGLALSGVWLIVCRALQGLGASLIAPTTLSLITTTFAEGPERNKAFGLVGALASLGFAAGAILGGLLTAGPGWRWVMFVNVPVGLFSLILVPFVLPESRVDGGQRKVDVLGAILVTVAITALVYALAQGNELGWTSWITLGLFTLAIVLLATFVFVELRSSAPLVRLGIFQKRNVTAASLISFLAPGVFGSLIFVLTLYMQKVLGYSAITTGLAFMPLALLILLASNIISRIVGRIGVKPLLVFGLGTTVVGILLFLGLSANGQYASTLLPGFLVVGLGMGPTFATMIVAATNGVSDDEQGLVSGVFNMTLQVGSGLALAIIVAVSASQTVPMLHQGVATKEALTAGFRAALLVCALLDVPALLIAIFLLPGAKRPKPEVLVKRDQGDKVEAL